MCGAALRTATSTPRTSTRRSAFAFGSERAGRALTRSVRVAADASFVAIVLVTTEAVRVAFSPRAWRNRRTRLWRDRLGLNGFVRLVVRVTIVVDRSWVAA